MGGRPSSSRVTLYLSGRWWAKSGEWMVILGQRSSKSTSGVYKSNFRPICRLSRLIGIGLFSFGWFSVFVLLGSLISLLSYSLVILPQWVSHVGCAYLGDENATGLKRIWLKDWINLLLGNCPWTGGSLLQVFEQDLDLKGLLFHWEARLLETKQVELSNQSA